MCRRDENNIDRTWLTERWGLDDKVISAFLIVDAIDVCVVAFNTSNICVIHFNSITSRVPLTDIANKSVSNTYTLCFLWTKNVLHVLGALIGPKWANFL